MQCPMPFYKGDLDIMNFVFAGVPRTSPVQILQDWS